VLPSLPWRLGWIGLAVPPLVFGATATYLLYRTVATGDGRTRRLERRVDELEAEVERLREDDDRDAEATPDGDASAEPPKG